MPITGRFLADFSSFYDAVQKAEVSLRSFETGAGKVETSLNKMVDSFSGRKIISEAELAVRAVTDLGGASKLTEAEQRRLNSTVTEAIAKYKALGFEAPPAMLAIANETKKVESAMGAAAKPTSAFMDYFKGTVAGMLTASAVIGTVKTAIRGLSEFIGSSVDAYAAQESAVKKMTTALQAQGTATPAVIGQYKAMASQFQNTTVFADELVTEMQALLTQVGNVMPSQMEGALKASTDLAAGLGIDLRQATMLVGKAFEGETGTLKRYGIVIDEAKLKTQGVTAVMDAIQSKFGGQAAAEVDTYAGQVKQLANAWDEVKEAIGKTIVQNPFVVAALRNATKALQDQGTELETSKRKWSDYFGIVGWGFDRIATRQAAINKGIADMSANLASAIANAPKFDIGSTRPNQFGQSPLDTAKIFDGWDAANKKSTEAANQHAAAVKQLMEAFSGKEAINAAARAMEAFVQNEKRGIDVARMTDEQTTALNKILGQAIETYRALGREAPSALQKVFEATQDVIDQQNEAKAQLDEWADTIKRHNEEWKAGEQATVDALAAIDKARFDEAKAQLDDWAEVVRQHQVDQAEGEKDTLDALKHMHDQAKQFQKDIQDLAGSLGHLADVSGGTFGSIVNDLANVVQAWGNAKAAADAYGKASEEGSKLGMASALVSGAGAVAQGTSRGSTLSRVGGGAAAGAAIGTAILPGWGTAIGAAAGALVGLVRGLKGVSDYQKSIAAFGGFDTLREKLTVLGDEGERLWIKLTQGTKGDKNKMAVLGEIESALGSFRTIEDEIAAAGYHTQAELQKTADTARKVYDAMKASGKYSAAAVQAAWEASEAAQRDAMGETDAARQQAVDAIKAMNDQIQTLTDSISGEAPEEFMGSIERQTRDQIAAIQTQRDEAQLALDETAGDAAAAAEDAAQAIEDTLAAHEFRVKIHFDYDDLSFPGSGRGGGSGDNVTVLNLDGREIARSTARYLPGALADQGIG